MKTVRTAKLGKLELRLVEKDKRFFGVVLDGGTPRAPIEGDSADDVWRRLHDEAAKSGSKYVGFDGARNRFLHFFPNGFQSDGYAKQERDYKVAAKSKLDSTVPVKQATTGAGFGEPILAVFRATNLLSPFEKTRMQGVLRGPAADAFVQAAARFTLGEGKPALLEMERVLKPHDNAKWTVATYLPFLWRPDQHMFLKPDVTNDFAARVGHRLSLDYEARLDLAVYESLLDLVDQTEKELADLKPRDRIDVQSFIWIVGNYSTETEAPSP
jgi:hypothetical protein